jgi:hypothetical protein
MSLKIYHTADVHLGMQFKNGRYSEDIRAALIEARFTTLQHMITEANQRQCDLFVIAGDLFDSLKVSGKIISRAAEIISGFTGEFVFVLPGNHDYVDSADDTVWTRFSKAAKEQVVLCDREEQRTFHVGEQTFSIFPGPCRSKHSAENAIGWIADSVKDDSLINIGIAHGAVAGLSPDNDDKYFLMTEKELADAGMHLWLLGHTHIHYPAKPGLQKPLFFMPATPEPDGFDCKHPGYAWYIEIAENGGIQYEQVQTGFYRFFDVLAEVTSASDLDAICEKWNQPAYKNALVRLTVQGRLPQDALQSLPKFEERMREQTAYFSLNTEKLSLLIDEQFIEKEYSEGSLPYLLLKQLAQKAQDPAVLTIAHELIEGARQ